MYSAPGDRASPESLKEWYWVVNFLLDVIRYIADCCYFSSKSSHTNSGPILLVEQKKEKRYPGNDDVGEDERPLPKLSWAFRRRSWPICLCRLADNSLQGSSRNEGFH